MFTVRDDYSPLKYSQPHPLRIQAIFWNSLGHGSVAYTANEILANMPTEAVERTLWSLGADPTNPRSFHKPALPNAVFRLLCKAQVPAASQGRLASEIALRSVKPGDIVYVWPPYDLRMIMGARDRGAIVVAERINCMATMVRDVLAPAFARRGLGLPPGWCTPASIAEDLEQMRLCDFITAPNKFVAQSILNAGIATSKVLETSYGFSPSRLASAINLHRPRRRPVFAFVGLGIVRKGFDVLLEAWDRADIAGRLILAGHIDEDLRRDYCAILARPDVEELGYVKDIASVYASADVFIFPTHEEGGPQVTYEAAACGLPSIVSPMGATRVVRDGVEGIIVDPLSVDSVAEAISRLAKDDGLRQRLGANAAQRAQQFTWDKVSVRLLQLFRGLTSTQQTQ